LDVLKWSKLFQKFLKGSERFQSLFRRFLNFPVLSRSSKFLDTNTFFILLLTDLNNLFHSLKVICACAQYLMVEYQMNLNQALAYIFQIHNSYSFQLDDCYFDYLGQVKTLEQPIPRKLTKEISSWPGCEVFFPFLIIIFNKIKNVSG